MFDIEIFFGQPRLGQAYGTGFRYQSQIKLLMLLLNTAWATKARMLVSKTKVLDLAVQTFGFPPGGFSRLFL